ncbi:MAG: pyridoxamine kinase [Lachnospira sp.]|nr:pyridoxamine kinase [Lachnospira sp.]
MKKVAVINDLSGFGKCSLSVALPIISVLSVQCVPLATAVFTSQTGFEDYSYTDLTDMIEEYIKNWKLNNASFDGIYSGYITDHKQAILVKRFIEEFRKEDTFLLIDPVLGDNGETYKMFTNDLLNIHKELTRQANIITPNLTEACLLADIPVGDILKCNKDRDSLIELASSAATILSKNALTNQEVIITGISVREGDSYYVYNLVLSEGEINLSKTPMIDKSFSGTGDIFASIITALKLNGLMTFKAVEIAQDFIAEAINDTPNDADTRDGVYFEKELANLASVLRDNIYY